MGQAATIGICETGHIAVVSHTGVRRKEEMKKLMTVLIALTLLAAGSVRAATVNKSFSDGVGIGAEDHTHFP